MNYSEDTRLDQPSNSAESHSCAAEASDYGDLGPENMAPSRKRFQKIQIDPLTTLQSIGARIRSGRGVAKISVVIISLPLVLVLVLSALSWAGYGLSWLMPASRLLHDETITPAVWISLFGTIVSSMVGALVAVSILHRELGHYRKSADSESFRQLIDYRLRLIDDLADLMTTVSAVDLSDAALRTNSLRAVRLVNRFEATFGPRDEACIDVRTALVHSVESMRICADHLLINRERSWMVGYLATAVEDVISRVGIRELLDSGKDPDGQIALRARQLNVRAMKKIAQVENDFGHPHSKRDSN